MLLGGGGNDTLAGLLGVEVMDGQGGTDLASYAGHTAPVIVILDGLANGGATGDGAQRGSRHRCPYGDPDQDTTRIGC